MWFISNAIIIVLYFIESSKYFVSTQDQKIKRPLTINFRSDPAFQGARAQRKIFEHHLRVSKRRKRKNCRPRTPTLNYNSSIDSGYRTDTSIDSIPDAGIMGSPQKKGEYKSPNLQAANRVR